MDGPYPDVQKSLRNRKFWRRDRVQALNRWVHILGVATQNAQASDYATSRINQNIHIPRSAGRDLQRYNSGW